MKIYHYLISDGLRRLLATSLTLFFLMLMATPYATAQCSVTLTASSNATLDCTNSSVLLTASSNVTNAVYT